MSLKPMDEGGAKKQKVRRSPKFDSFPELDQMFDEFDSDKRKELGLPDPEEKRTEFEKFNEPSPVVKKSLPVFDLEIEEKETEDEYPSDEDYFEGESDKEEYYDNKEENEGKIKDDFPTFEMPEEKDDFPTFEMPEEDYDDSEEGVFSTVKEELENEPDSFEELEDEVEDDEDFKDVEVEKENNKKEGDSKFKEVDEEKVKEFFTGMFKKKNKEGKPKPNKEKSPKEKKPKEKDKKQKPAKEKKERTPVNKKTKILAIIGIIIVVLIVAVFFLGNKGYASIGDLSFNLEEDLSVSSITAGEISNFKVKNEGDISKSAFFYVTLQEKSAIPFLGSKIECESDIVDVITGGEAQGSMKCSTPLEEEKKYKYLEATASEI